MDDFTRARVREVVDAVQAHCLRPCELLGQHLKEPAAQAMHLKWAFPVFHVPFFSNTFVAAYLYAEALTILLGQNGTPGEIAGGDPAWIKDLIIQQEWSREKLQVFSQFRFNMFFSDLKQSTPDLLHLLPRHVERADCFSYSHTEAFTDSPDSFEYIMRTDKRPLLIVTDIPAEAERVKDRALQFQPNRKVLVAGLGERSMGSVLSDASASNGSFIRLFFFGSPKTEIFRRDNEKRRENDRARRSIPLAQKMSLSPVKTDLAVHFKYREDAGHAKEFLHKLAGSVRRCIKAADDEDVVAYKAAGPFFKNVAQQYNRLARSIAVGNQLPELQSTPREPNDPPPIEAFYAQSIWNHAAPVVTDTDASTSIR